MKKLFILAIMAASTASFAQGIVGPKVGLNISNIKNTKTPSGQSAADFDAVVTPTLGVVFNAQIGEYFALRPEILWVQRGAKQKASFFGSTITSTTTLNYAEIPFNLVGRIPAGPGKIEVFAGPSVGYMFGGKNKTNGTTTNIKGADEPSAAEKAKNNDTNGYINYLNVSLNFGVGYNWRGLIFQAGYNLGLSNLTAHPEVRDDQAAVDARKEDVYKASAVTFGVAYLFGNKE